MGDSIEVHRWVAEYNWDDGLAAIWPIVDSRNTEHATALMIYWRLEGPWLESTNTGASAGARKLCLVVKERLLGGFYFKGSCRYDPVADRGLSKTQVYKLKKAGLPDELLEPEDPPRG